MKKISYRKPSICSEKSNEKNSSVSVKIKAEESDIDLIKSFSFISKKPETALNVKSEYFLRSKNASRDVSPNG
jgi:hypothetical protein